jgi:hypothetical protein
MRIRPRLLAAAAALASLVLAAGCTSSGTVGDLRHPPQSDNIVSSLFNPSPLKKLPSNGSRQAHDGGLSDSQTLPSFDNAPLPRQVGSEEIQPPYTAQNGAVTGKLFFFRAGEENSGNYYVCSGTAVSSKNRSLVWTAGHCVHDGKGGDWHADMVFVPAFDNTGGDTDIDPADLSAYAPLGTFMVTHAWTSSQWKDSGDEHGGDLAHDYAVVEVGRNDRGQTLDDAITSAGAGRPVPIWFDAGDQQVTSAPVDIKGYPAAPPFDGMTQYGCQVDTVQLLNVTELGPDAKEYRAGCDLTGGASGGGWFARAPGQAAGEVSLISNTSVGSAHTSSRSWLAGPYLDGEAQALYQTANSFAAP